MPLAVSLPSIQATSRLCCHHPCTQRHCICSHSLDGGYGRGCICLGEEGKEQGADTCTLCIKEFQSSYRL